MVEDKLFHEMAFIIGHKREKDGERLEKRQSGKLWV